MKPNDVYEALLLQKRLEFLSLTDLTPRRGIEPVGHEMRVYYSQYSDVRTLNDLVENLNKIGNLE